MTLSHRLRPDVHAALSAAVLSMYAIGCHDTSAPLPTPTGGAVIRLTTLGLDIPSAFSVSIDDGPNKLVLPAGVLIVKDLATGTHTVRIQTEGTAANCAVSGEHPRVVTVTANESTPVDFDVTCVSTTAVIAYDIATNGLDFPAAFLLQVDATAPLAIPPTYSSIITGLPAGAHTLSLQSAQPNCSVSGANPRTVTLTTGTMTRDTARTTFAVTCTATTGVLEVAIATTGEDQDGSGYIIRVGAISENVHSPNTTYRRNVAAGDYLVRLDSVAENCTMAGEHPQTLSIRTGGVTRDTARAAFSVGCAKVDRIAFVRDSGGPRIAVVNANGSNLFRVNFDGRMGSWTPDGKRIVTTGIICDTYYYYGCSYMGLYMVSMDKLPSVTTARLTTNWADSDPAMAPNGQLIVFVRGTQLMTINSDGSSLAALVTPNALINLRSAGAPSWSPDGSKLAFTCIFGNANWSDICTVNANGSELKRVTADPWNDTRPTWSPDGTTILFATNRSDVNGDMHVATMRADGTSFIQLTDGETPAWSPNGSRIVFARYGSDPGLFTMNADGSQVTRLTRGLDNDPVWRP